MKMPKRRPSDQLACFDSSPLLESTQKTQLVPLMSECFELLCKVPMETFDPKLLVQRVHVVRIPLGENKKGGWCIFKIQIYCKLCIYHLVPGCYDYLDRSKNIAKAKQNLSPVLLYLLIK